MGMAKPMPSMDAPELVVPEYLAVVMPMISPYILNSGPPELPGLMAASVWSILMTVLSVVTSRLMPLTYPTVSVAARRPRGLPMATTMSPMERSEVLPMDTADNPSASTFKTATSFVAS